MAKLLSFETAMRNLCIELTLENLMKKKMSLILYALQENNISQMATKTK